MARFVFSMESILQIKCKLEDQARAEYAVQMARLHQEQQKLDDLIRYKEQKRGAKTKKTDTPSPDQPCQHTLEPHRRGLEQ